MGIDKFSIQISSSQITPLWHLNLDGKKDKHVNLEFHFCIVLLQIIFWTSFLTFLVITGFALRICTSFFLLNSEDLGYMTKLKICGNFLFLLFGGVFV